MEKYPEKTLRYFHAIKHAGQLDLDENIFLIEQGSMEQGDVIQLYIRFENGTVTKACFKCYGSVASIAACEYVCRELQGKSLREVAMITQENILTALGLSALYNHVAVRLAQCIGNFLMRMS